MTREECRKFIKSYFKSRGFQSEKSFLFKMLDDDYLICCYLDPSTYVKGYSFYCGAIYLPDEYKIPLNGLMDIEWTFQFPMEPGGMLDLSEYPNRGRYRHIFEYELYSLDELETILNTNYDFFINPLYNKEYELQILRQKWDLMRRFTTKTVIKLCNRAGIDSAQVLEYLGK